MDGASAAARSDRWICRWCARLARQTSSCCCCTLTSSAGNTYSSLHGHAGKLRTSGHHVTHNICFRRSPPAQTSPSRLHTTGYQRRLPPRHKHPQTNSEPRHIKGEHRPTPHFASLELPAVSRSAPWPNRFLTLSDSQQTIISEDKSFTTTFPCCTLHYTVRVKFHKCLHPRSVTLPPSHFYRNVPVLLITTKNLNWLWTITIKKQIMTT